MERVNLIAEYSDLTILLVSSEVTHMGEVVQWHGGFLVPHHSIDDMFCHMATRPSGNDNDDIVVFLYNGEVSVDKYMGGVYDQLQQWGLIQ